MSGVTSYNTYRKTRQPNSECTRGEAIYEFWKQGRNTPMRAPFLPPTPAPEMDQFKSFGNPTARQDHLLLTERQKPSFLKQRSIFLYY